MGTTSSAGVADSPSTRQSIFSASHLAAQSLFLNVISVPVTAYIVRNLGASGFGQWATAASLVNVASLLMNLGLRGTFVRSVAKDSRSARQALAEQLGIRLLLCLIGAFGATGACIALNYPRVVIECAVIASAGLFLTTFATTLSDLLQGLHRISVYAAVGFIAGLALTGASIVVTWLRFGPVGLSVAYLFGPLVSAVLLFAYVQRNLFPVQTRWSLGRSWRLLKDAKFFAIQNVTNTLSVNAELLLLPKLVGSHEYGYFSAGLLLISRLGIIPESLGSTFYPVIARASAKDPKLATSEVVRSLFFMLIVSLPVVVVVTFFSGPVAHVLFPKSPDACKRVICITIWALPLLGMECVSGYALNAAGREASHARITLYAAAMNLVLAVVLVTQFGIVGAAWSYLLRTAVKVTFTSVLFVETFSPPLSVVRFLRVLACGCAMAAAMWLGRHYLPVLGRWEAHLSGVKDWVSMFAALSLEGALGMAAYAGSLWFLRVLRLEDLMQFLRRKPQVETA
ncbi:MAG TPA: polysaccharide biosynthesis C-terminal domain-containing protein [Isosphaeraceae bacterium]|nr:polysaccharide biosynthesis C-terminal domain-containing protein [Isosphaeraceae bacterium]